MSRMTLCCLTSAALVLLSVGTMVARYRTVGDEVETPTGPNTWKLTLTVHGQAEAGARVYTSAPLDFRRQHVLREQTRSRQLEPRPSDARDPRRRSVVWTLRTGTKPGPFKLRCEYICAVEVSHPSSGMNKTGLSASTPPRGRYLDVEPRTGPERDRLSTLACQLTEGHDKLGEQAHTLFDYVSKEITNEPSVDEPHDNVGAV